MQADFSIEVDDTRDLIRLRLTGFFCREDVARLDAARRQAYRRLRCPRGAHRTLCDVSDMKIQPQEVVGAFAQLAADPQFASRKLAFVTNSSLARVQAQRVSAEARTDVAFFMDRGAAEAWLLE